MADPAADPAPPEAARRRRKRILLWGVGLPLYLALVTWMAWRSLPNALTGAQGLNRYQEEQTQRMLDSYQREAGEEADGEGQADGGGRAEGG